MKKRSLKIVGFVLVLVVLLGASVVIRAGISQATAHLVSAVKDNSSDLGVLIASVLPDSPAEKAGLSRGDIVLRLNEKRVNHPRELAAYINDLEQGAQVELVVLHGDEERTLAANLDEQNGRAFLGLVPCSCDAVELDWTEIEQVFTGAFIIEVLPGSPAEEVGLQAGDVIVAVEGQEPGVDDDLADLITVYEPGDQVTLEIMRPDSSPQSEPETAQFVVELGDKEGIAYLGVQYAQSPHLNALKGFDFSVAPFAFELPDIEQGAFLPHVDAASPAAEAGLKAGDVITAVDGEPLADAQALVDAISQHAPGGQLILSVKRLPDEELELVVTLAEHPDKPGVAYLGISLGTAPHVRLFEGRLPEGQFLFEAEPFFAPVQQSGLVVRQVLEDSPAAAAGLQTGDLITSVEGQPLDNPQALVDLIAKHEPDDAITLSVKRNGEALELVVTLAEHPEKENSAYLGVQIGAAVRIQRFAGQEWRPPFFENGQAPFDWEDVPFDLDALPHFWAPPDVIEIPVPDFLDNSA